MSAAVPVTRKSIDFRADATRVLLKPFIPTSETQIRKILERILKMPEATVERSLQGVMQEFAHRHGRFQKILWDNYRAVEKYLPDPGRLSENRKLLIGAFFTHEYSVEAAALFNPSIVPHPDQSGLSHGQQRFVLSLRATGEGHISSIEFRSGVLSKTGDVTLDCPTPLLSSPERSINAAPDAAFVRAWLQEQGIPAQEIASLVPETAGPIQLATLQQRLANGPANGELQGAIAQLSVDGRDSRAGYRLRFEPEIPLCERVIFPVTRDEQNGIEDARFVQFCDGERCTYFATYTAYDGKNIAMKLIHTDDFLEFHIYPLLGAAVKNKGMALFPERINGKFAAISRQDGESLFFMTSDSPFEWQEAEKIRVPEMPWETVKIGNCGSPIKTEAGWLLLTHGVGPLRKYVIGVYLLDLEDPRKIIGLLDEPLLSPNDAEREGYVPNVVYSCGGMLHNDELILPYAYSDSGAGFATIPVQKLLSALIRP